MFKQDLEFGAWGEKIMVDYITNKLTTYNRLCIFTGSSRGKSLKDYDLRFDLLNNVTKEITYEVKTDKYEDTGNVFFEKSCNGVESGVIYSKADYFIYFLPRKKESNLYYIRTENLKHILTTIFHFCISYGAGDGGRVVGYLINTQDFDEVFIKYGGEIITLDVNIPDEYNLTRF
jgi:hypothetical protein